MKILPAICLALSVAAVASAEDGRRIAILPFDNLSGAQDSALIVSGLVAQQIAARGWQTADGSEVESLLETERVRYLDALENRVVQKIVQSTHASAALTGTIYTWSAGRNPAVALAARLTNPDGSTEWTDVAATSSDDTEHLFGFGRTADLNALAASAVASLMQRFPRADGGHSSAVRPRAPLFGSRPATYLSRDLAVAARKRICILPFENLSAAPDAPRIVTEVLTLRLAAEPSFEVVSPAEMRAAALATRIGSFRGITSAALTKLGAALNTNFFVLGTIYQFSDPAGHTGGDAALEVELSLIDVKAGHVLWTAQHARSGSDYIGFLLLGKVTTVVGLADRVAGELIAAEIHAPPHDAPQAARITRKHPESIQTLRKAEESEHK